MTHVLGVAALEVGYPVILFVLMESRDAARERRAVGESSQIRTSVTTSENMLRPVVAVYLDGLRIQDAASMDVLNELSTVEVEAIELYVGASQLPQEAMGNACAAIYVLSRFSSGKGK